MMRRKPLIVANWKMHHTVSEALAFVTALSHELKATGGNDIVVAAPFTALYSLSVVIAEEPAGFIKLAGQNMHWEQRGAFTGEISADFLKDVGCEYVILGHSERRRMFGDTDECVHDKVLAALRAELMPIVCVGENAEQRDAGNTWHVVESQLRSALSGAALSSGKHLAIAYEPVWAIGTGKHATPDQAQEVHHMIRHWVTRHGESGVGQEMRIIYGGSVTPENSAELLSQQDIDGVLVGGASLHARSFADIIRSAR